MALSGIQQQAIQYNIEIADENARFEIESKSKAILAEINTLMSLRKLTAEERKATDVAIENLVRLDATKRGKGAWYRMKKRLSLTTLYLG